MYTYICINIYTLTCIHPNPCMYTPTFTHTPIHVQAFANVHVYSNSGFVDDAFPLQQPEKK